MASADDDPDSAPRPARKRREVTRNAVAQG